MQLLLIRHAIAEDAVEFASTGGTDAQRPLIDMGRKKMRKGANRLRFQVQGIDVLACSTLRRARETAEIIALAFGDLPILERPDMAPYGDLDSLLVWLTEQPATSTVALVGHEPQLNLLAGLLLVGTPRPLLSLKKGGVILIDFDARAEPGAGRLRWALTPAQLRSLKD